MKSKYFGIICAVLVFLSNQSGAQSTLTATTHKKTNQMTETTSNVSEKELYSLNAQFIRNFTTMDTVAHNKIIHPDFVCINSDGSISGRDEYMKGWATGYKKSGYTSFSITDENIRIFGDMALVRSRTVYTKTVDGESVQGSSVYTDTYVKENGKWLCVQAHITPVKSK